MARLIKSITFVFGVLGMALACVGEESIPMPPFPAGKTIPFVFTSSEVATAAGTYNGLFLHVGEACESGFLSLKLTTNGAFSGVVFLDSDSVPISGRFTRAGVAKISISRENVGKSRLGMLLNLDLAKEGTGQIMGTVHTTNWSSTLRVIRTGGISSAQDRRFTILLNPLGKNTCGYGVGMVAASGETSVAGSLADGSAFSQSVAISKNGEWPFYAVLSPGHGRRSGKTKSTGVLFGWLTVSNGVPGGQLTWARASETNGIVFNGSTNLITARGAAYQPPLPGTSILNLTNAVVELWGDGLSAGVTNFITMNKDGSVVSNGDNRLKLDFYRSSGLLTGSLNKSRVIKGVVLQGENRAEGYFIGTDGSGTFRLHGAP